MTAHILTGKSAWWNSLARPIRNQTRSTLIFSHDSFTASPIVCYVFAALAGAVATGPAFWFAQFAESRPFPLFFLPVLFSGWFLGRGAGFLATGLLATVIQYFFYSSCFVFCDSPSG